MLQRLWERLGRGYPSGMLESALCEAIGDDAVLWLENSHAATIDVMKEDGYYPCKDNAAQGCAMRLLAAEPGMRAFCGQRPPECEPLAFDSAPRWVHIDERTLIPLLQRAIGIDQLSLPERDVVHLGERAFGEGPVSFLFAPCPQSGLLYHVIDHLRERHPLAIVVFTRSQIPPKSSKYGELYWLALSDTGYTSSELVIDRVALWDHFAPGADAGEEFWPSLRLVANAENGELRYEGRLVQLDPASSYWRLLVALLSRPERLVSYLALAPAVCPELQPTDKSGQLKDNVRQCLRKAKHHLQLALAEAKIEDLVETVPTRAGTEGGYRIRVAKNQARILFEPDGSAPVRTVGTSPHP